MKIKSIRPFLKNLALTRPYTITGRTISTVENVFLEIILENGLRGMGSANPAPEVVGEGPAETLQNLQGDFIQAFAGRDIRHFRQMIDETRAGFPYKPGTQAAVDIALHDTFGKYLGIPVVELYGQKHRAMPTSVTIGIKDTAATLEESREYRERGFRVLKVKLGLDPAEDLERIIKLREKHGDAMTIRVDANLGYNFSDLRRFIEKTESLGVELIEQPMPVGAEPELQQLAPEQRRRLAADESLKDARAALKLSADPQPYGIYNIKLMKCGGLLGAFDIAAIARAADIELFWGCNDESIVSITAALHAAFACPHTRYLDLDGSLDLAEDAVTGGFILENGMMRASDAPGFGISLLI